jgi:hypothetical protein
MQEFRPLSVSDILDTTFRLYRDRFVTFLLIALVVYVPYSLLATLITPAEQAAASAASHPSVATGPGHLNPRVAQPATATAPQFNVTGFVLGLLGVFVFAVIFMPLCTAALTHNISAAYLGKELSAGESYKRAAPRLAGLIGSQILAGIIVFLGFLLLIVPGVIFSLWFYVLVPVVVLEGVSGTAALGRSRELMRGNLGKAFLVGLLIGIVSMIIGAILGFAVGFIPWPYVFLRVFVQSLVQALLMPIQTAPFILLYYDLRIRKEAFDLQMLSTALEQPAAT